MMLMVEEFIETIDAVTEHRGVREDTGSGDPLFWLAALHVALLEAGEAMDRQQWEFLVMWFVDVAW